MNYFDKMCFITGYESVSGGLIWGAWETLDSNPNSTIEDSWNVYREMKNKYCNLESYKEWTEVVMVLNWKVWEHYENGFEELSLIYNDLWKQADSDAINLFEGH